MRVSVGWAGSVTKIKKASKSERRKKKKKKSPESGELVGFCIFFSLKIAGIWPDLFESKLDLTKYGLDLARSP